jgi:HK97 family phage prohead protease
MTMELRRAGFPMQLRNVSERVLEGIAVPWDELTHLVANPAGERFMRGSLTRTVQERGARLKLFRDHDHSHAIGRPLKLDARHPAGLWARWQVFETPWGDEALAEVEQGALDMFSVGFQPLRVRRGPDGANEVVEAALGEVSLCPMGAFDGAQLLATRSAVVEPTTRDSATALRGWLDSHPVPELEALTAGPVVLPPWA